MQFGVHSGPEVRWQWAYRKLGFSAAAAIDVAAGATAVVDDTKLDPGSVQITVTDAVSGAPVDDVCAGQVESMPTDCGATNGVITMAGLSDGTRQFYLSSPRGLYKRASVADVKVVYGTVTRAAVAMTPAAAITTTVVDAATGEPIDYGCASVLPVRRGLGGAEVGPSCSGWGDEGRYTITGLGPYEWPVQFSHDSTGTSYASVWSGGATDRKAATLIPAGIEEPTVLDGALSTAGPGLTVSAKLADGQAYDGWLHVEAYNARTGDYVGELSSNRMLEAVAEQPVRLKYVAGSEFAAGWHGGTNFATASNVRVRPGDPRTVKLTLLEK